MAEPICFEYDQDKLAQRAKERGYASIQAYLQALIEEDVPNPADGLREALREFRLGRGRPAADWLNEHAR